MKNITHKHRWNLLLVLFILLYSFENVFAASRDDLRIRAGLDLFTSLLAADLDIADKRGREGDLLLLLIYRDKKDQAEEMMERLSQIREIHGFPIRIEISDYRLLDRYENMPPAGMFVAQPLEDALDSVIEFSRRHGIVLFSPFSGDVEKGVLGGIHISDRLLPHINLSAMEASGIRIKQFFLRVSLPYE